MKLLEKFETQHFTHKSADFSIPPPPLFVWIAITPDVSFVATFKFWKIVTSKLESLSLNIRIILERDFWGLHMYKFWLRKGHSKYFHKSGPDPIWSSCIVVKPGKIIDFKYFWCAPNIMPAHLRCNIFLSRGLYYYILTRIIYGGHL